LHGVNRFGDPACETEDPDPNFVAVLRRLTAFDVPGAVPWVPREIGIELESAAHYPPEYAMRAVAWPPELPAPEPPKGTTRSFRTYDGSFAVHARRLVSPFGNSFVLLNGTAWAYHYREDLLPEHGYLERVFKALDEGEDRLSTEH
jgi:hypothetical protein